MRRTFERNHRHELIALAGQPVVREMIRPRPRLIPLFIWKLIVGIVIKPHHA